MGACAVTDNAEARSAAAIAAAMRRGMSALPIADQVKNFVLAHCRSKRA